MRYLLDTSAAILIRDVPAGSNRELLALNGVPVLSVVTRVEMEGGLAAEPALAERRRSLLDQMLATFPVIDFDGACADAYRVIVEARGYSRRKVADRMIAATALAHGLTLVSANAADFRDVPDLALIGW